MSNLTVGLIQSTLLWEQPAENRKHFEPKLAELAAADLIVLPEMFSTGFSMASKANAEPMTGPTVEWLAQQSSQLNTAICGSVIIRENDQFFNRFLLFKPNQAPMIYNKRHLFRMAGEHNYYSPGAERVVTDLASFRVCPQVCYDLRFPVFSRNHQDYDVLLYVANWPAPRRQQWRTLLTARAIENQAYVIAVNRIGTDGNDVEYSGDSGVISPDGTWIEDLKDADVSKLVELDLESLQRYRRDFPAWQDADLFTLDER